jgi:hypothetical protein
MKTIGTLEEIGAQAGDVVEYHGGGVPGGHRTVASDKPNSNGWWMATDGYEMGQSSPYWRIVTRAAKSPIRTVTRKEVVPGEYGRVQVFDGGAVSVTYCPYSDLTAAIATLTEIRDAMQENT